MVLRWWEIPAAARRTPSRYAAVAALCVVLCLAPAGTGVARPAGQDATEAKDPAPDTSAVESNLRMRVELDDGGIIEIDLLPDEAPKAVARIVQLAEEGFYDGEYFHRVESYLVQAGRKETDLEPIEGEMFMQQLTHEEGMVGMARLPDDYDSATNQFYICKEHMPKLNGEYTLFGRVVTGMDCVHEMERGCKIKCVTIER